MSARPKFQYYLVHQETGQRYPVADEVVIGRSAGDILFPEDSKLSGKHCRIVRTPSGLGIHDLGSHNGTIVDRMELDPEKIYAFKTGSVLIIGDQILKLQDASYAKRVTPKRRKRRRKSRFDMPTFLAGLLVIAAAAIFLHSLARSGSDGAPDVKLESPAKMVERELRSALDEYAQVANAYTAGGSSAKQLGEWIRGKLVPRLTALNLKLDVLRPAGEWERRKLEANKRLIVALIAQLNVMAAYAETGDVRHGKELQTRSEQVEAAHRELRKLESLRAPAQFDY